MKKNEKLAVEVNDLNVRFGNNTVLEHITFNVKKGEYLGIIGPNGGGKSTLLKVILGLMKPSSGSVKIFGTNVEDFKDRSRIGYVHQKSSQANIQFPATVEEIVRSGRTARIGVLKRFSAHDFSAVEKAMETTGVIKFRHRLIGQLSGGERQKVFIARALSCEPEILILDEPTTAIDVASQGNFFEFMADLNKKLGLTVIFVSHDIDVVAKEVTSVLCLNRGLVCHGAPAEFIKDEYLEKLYGKKVKFILHGH